MATISMSLTLNEFSQLMRDKGYSQYGIDELFDYYSNNYSIGTDEITAVWTEYSKEGLEAAFDADYAEYLTVNELASDDLSLIEYLNGSYFELIETDMGSFLVKQVC